MGILARFRDIMAADINAFLDKCEDPAKMIDQYLRDLMEDLAEVKKETAGVMAEEKRTKRLLDENQADVEKYLALSKKALSAGSEEDAKVFLAKKQALEASGTDLQKTWEVAHANAERMREMHDKLTGDIQMLEQRRQNVHAKVAVAKTQARINDITNSMASAAGAMNAFERMESKADHMLDQADSMAELNAGKPDAVGSLEEKYAEPEGSSVNEELEKLKREMGL